MKDQKRGKNVAVVGAVLQAIIVVVVVILWRMSDSHSAFTSLWLLVGGVFLWLMTVLLFYARQLERQEAVDLQELMERGGGEGTIFEEQEKLDLRPARQRLEFLLRWIVPVFTLLFAAYHATLGLLMIRYLRTAEPLVASRPMETALFLLIIGFGAFLFSRYCTGMSSQPQWRLLRATGSYLLICVLFIWSAAAGMLFVSQGVGQIETIVAFILPGIQLIFAAELLLNFVLDIYRPRLPDDEYRPSYDSRLFNLLAEPTRVGHSIADTINYQFGFEVSGTWFYQLISRAFVPLIAFAVLVMFGMTSIVVVNDGEQCVVKHWGKVPADHQTLEAGIHFKWPWPIDTAERFETGLIHEITLGVGQSRSPSLTRDRNELVLWTEEHGAQTEENFLIGVPPRQEVRRKTDEGETGKAPSVSIIKLVVLLQYRVSDVYKYGYQFTDAGEMLRYIANQEMVRYCASGTLDEVVSDETDRPQAIMTSGRSAAAKTLQRRIQKRLDEAGVGVELVFAGIIAAHPPVSAVPQFEKVMETERLQDQQRYAAEAEASRILAEVAGDPGDALELFLALRKGEVFEELSKQKDIPEQFAPAVEEFIRRAEGQIKALGLEIYREKLLGKKDSNLKTRIRLQKAYEEFLHYLRLAQKDREGFDYTARVEKADQAVKYLFDGLEGEPAKLLAEARAYRWERELKEQSDLETYRRKLLPYLAAPRVYMFDRYMDVLDEVLPDMKKYVVGVDRDLLEIRLNLEQHRDVMGEALQNTDQMQR